MPDKWWGCTVRTRLLAFASAAVLVVSQPTEAQIQQHHVEHGFTVWDDVAAVQWPDGARHRALLIGNKIYDKGDTPASGLPPLSNLITACDDARLIAASLAKAGWRPEEIAVACNTDTGSLNTSLNTLIDGLPNVDDGSALTIVYLGGHGVQAGRSNYFFGTNAHPDFDKAADTILSHSDSKIFLRDATDAMSAFTVALGREAPSSIMLILDACRDDPIFDHARDHLVDRMRNRYHLDDKTISQIVNGALSAPKSIGTVPPTAMQILYASSDGFETDDDTGTGDSRVAAALASTISSSRIANDVIGETVTKVVADTSGFPAPKQQTPDANGYLRSGTCLSGCDAGRRAAHLEGGVGKAGESGSLRFWLTSFEPDSSTNYDPDSSGAIASLPRTVTLLQPRAGYAGASATGEVFWCSVGNEAVDKARYMRALYFAKSILGMNSYPGGSPSSLNRLRVTELDANRNSRSAYQISSDVIQADTLDEELARSLSKIDTTIKLTVSKTGTPHYLAVFFCDGAYHGPKAVTVYIQVPSRSSLETASAVIDKMHSSFPELNTIPDAEVREVSPGRTQVRFFSPVMSDQAKQLSIALSQTLGVKVVAADFSKYHHNAAANNQLEIWIGEKDENNIAKYLSTTVNAAKPII